MYTLYIPFPTGRWYCSGCGRKETRRYTGEMEDFRPTIHFALGELVQPHRAGNWDDQPYGIVTPLRAIKDQVVNILPVDIFVVGDLHLNSESDELFWQSEPSFLDVYRLLKQDQASQNPKGN